MAQVNDEGRRFWRPVDPMRHHREGGWDYRGRAIYHFTLPVEGLYRFFLCFFLDIICLLKSFRVSLQTKNRTL